MGDPRLCLQSEGRWYYLLSQPTRRSAGVEYEADGQPMQPEQGSWWSIDREATLIEHVATHPGVITGYALNDPAMASQRFPLDITPEQYDEIARLDDEIAMGLYSSVRADPFEVREEVEGPWLRLDGKPDQHPDRTWVCEPPYAVRTWPSVHHLFPGRLPGFGDYLIARLKRLDKVDFVLRGEAHQRHLVNVTLSVPFDPPQFIQERPRNRDGRPSRSRPPVEREQMHQWRLSFRVPFDIEGPDKATAVAEWDRLADDIVADVIVALNAAACPHCDGTGVARPAQAKVSTSRNR